MQDILKNANMPALNAAAGTVVAKLEAPALNRKAAAFSDFLREERAKRDALREQHRAELHNKANTTHSRICAWESLHDLRLPSDPSHPILLAIAVAVGIPMALIRNEQVARAASAAG